MPYQSTIEAKIAREPGKPHSYRVLVYQLDTSDTPERALEQARKTIEALEARFRVHIRQIRVFEVSEPQED